MRGTAVWICVPHAACADLVLQMDCDFSHDPADLGRLIDAARDADVGLGSRYVSGGGIQDWPPTRRLISRVEVPIVFSDRALGASKMSRGIALEAARVVLELRRRPPVPPVAEPAPDPVSWAGAG